MRKMRLLLPLLGMALVSNAANLSVAAKITSFTGNTGSVEVTLRNMATKIVVPLKVTVTYLVNGVSETVSTVPFEASIVHPIQVNGFRLDAPGDWLQLNTPMPLTLLDGEATTFTINFAQVTVIR